MFSLPKYHLRRLSKRLRPPKPLPPLPDPYADEEQGEISPKLFEHEALNLGSPSIRLIQICPARDTEDPIRCRIRLASTDTEYTCLSYVWGEECIDKWIYINDERATVRQNLSSFLLSARQVPELTSQWLWIDALCIDQTNTLERQHQVQQMGRIYAGAKEVISWLGTDRDIVTYFSKSVDERKDDPRGLMALSCSSYWTRAWVVQEILLGHHVRLMADRYMLPLDALPAYHTGMPLKWNLYGIIQTRILHTRMLLRTSDQSGVTLIRLLDYFQFQNCHIDRDRVFSLLGLCKGGTGLVVDYSISDFRLALRVLAFCSDSFCLCAILTVAKALPLSLPSSLGGYNDDFRSSTYASLVLPTTWPERNEYMMPQDDPWTFENSECRRHRGEICQKNYPHSIFVCKPSATTNKCRIKITINLRHLCPKYCDQVTIKVYRTTVTVIYSAEDGKLYKHEWDGFDDGSIALQTLDHGRTCTILMSLSLWFHVMKLASTENYTTLLDEACCSRITGLGNQSLENYHMPALKFPADQHASHRYNLPRDVDRFICDSLFR
jgi:hypothetical protein